MNFSSSRVAALSAVVTSGLAMLIVAATPALASRPSLSPYRPAHVSFRSVYGTKSNKPARALPVNGRFPLYKHSTLPAGSRAALSAALLGTRGSLLPVPKTAKAVTSASLKMKQPSGFLQQSGGVTTSSWDDNTNNNFFTLFHSSAHPYTKNSVKGGYHQESLTRIHVAKDAEAYWLGSYTPSASKADGVVQDAVDTLTKGQVKFTDYSCSNFTDNCHLFQVGLQDNQGHEYAVIFAIWSTQNVVGEVGLLTDINTANNYTNDYANRFIQLIQAGVVTVYASLGQTPPPVRITSLSLLHKNNGQFVATSKLHLNEFAIFIGTYQSSVTGQQTATLTIIKGAKTIFSSPMSTGQLSDGTPAFLTAGAFQTTSALGKLTAKVTVKVGKASATTALSLTIVK